MFLGLLFLPINLKRVVYRFGRAVFLLPRLPLASCR